MESTPALRRHVDEIWPGTSDLLVAADAVAGLDGNPGWSAVLDVLDAEIAMIDAKLDGATEPLSQAHYAQLHGRRGGLQAARLAAGAIIGKGQEREHRAEAATDVVAGRS